MKKFFALAAVVAVALTSCVETVEIPDPAGEIAFKAVNFKNQTRAEVTGPLSSTAYPESEHFGAYAYHDTKNWGAVGYVGALYMDNVEISKQTNDTWKNSTRSYYWPKTGALSFFCYSPYNLSPCSGTVSCTVDKGIAVTNFTTNNTLTKTDGKNGQVDLMATDVIKDKTTNNVPAAFHHLLSQIVVAVAPGANDYATKGVTSITVDRVVLGGVGSVASYDSTNGMVAGGTWTPPTTDIAYTFVSAPTTVTLSSTDAVQVGEAALVIPQNCVANTITVDYTINYDGGAKDIVTNHVYTIPADAAIQDWAMGKKYTYTITVGLGDEILFEPSISEDWGDGGSTSITVGTGA